MTWTTIMHLALHNFASDNIVYEIYLNTLVICRFLFFCNSIMRTLLFFYLDSILRTFSSLTLRFLIADIFFRQLKKNDRDQADAYKTSLNIYPVKVFSLNWSEIWIQSKRKPGSKLKYPRRISDWIGRDKMFQTYAEWPKVVVSITSNWWTIVYRNKSIR